MHDSSIRDTYKYYLLNSRGTVVYAGITTQDLDQRERQHQREPEHKNTKIEQQGNRTTNAAARKWEQEQKRNGIKINHSR